MTLSKKGEIEWVTIVRGIIIIIVVLVFLLILGGDSKSIVTSATNSTDGYKSDIDECLDGSALCSDVILDETSPARKSNEAKS